MKNIRTTWKTRVIIYLSLPFGLLILVVGIRDGDTFSIIMSLAIMVLGAGHGIRDKCLMFGHNWDGHTCGNYPAPKCRTCGEWHWRKKDEEPWGYEKEEAKEESTEGRN